MKSLVEMNSDGYKHMIHNESQKNEWNEFEY